MAKKLKGLNWDFDKYGFKLINWFFPKDDEPHCETVLSINTGLYKINNETYSFSNCPLPWDDELEMLENLKTSINLAIKEIKRKVKGKN